MTALWLRATDYVLLGGEHLYPGEATRFRAGSPVHEAAVGEIACGRSDVLELVEAASDPSGPPPADPPDPAAERARAATRSHERRLRGENPIEPPHESTEDNT